MCDGEYDSWCNRDDENGCLLYAQNDGRRQLVFDSLSGWGIFEIPNVRQGLIIIKFHDWLQENTNAATDGWTTVNNNAASMDGRQLRDRPLKHGR